MGLAAISAGETWVPSARKTSVASAAATAGVLADNTSADSQDFPISVPPRINAKLPQKILSPWAPWAQREGALR